MSHRRVLDEFAQQTAPKPETLARLQERLAVDTAGSFLRRRSRVVPVLVVAAAAAAAVLTVAWWPSATPVAVAPSAPMAVPLRSDDWVDAEPVPEVALHYQGIGRVSGPPKAPQLDWTSGTVDVEVTPQRGISLSVHTREAVVRVVGTGFSVTRDALGTHVQVAHGRVAVDCAGTATTFLGAGDERTCLPTSPAGRLARAVALHEGGASAEDVLAAAEAARPGAEDVVRAEVAFLEVQVLVEAGRRDEALGYVEELKRIPASPRLQEAERLLR